VTFNVASKVFKAALLSVNATGVPPVGTRVSEGIPTNDSEETTVIRRGPVATGETLL
jgi:hypothetical protein